MNALQYVTGFNLIFGNAVVKTFSTDLTFNDLMSGVEGRNFLKL